MANLPAATGSDHVRRAIRHRKNPVFSTRDIVNGNPDVSRALVDQVISRMVRAGELERISRGLFSRPRHHRYLGALPPSSEDIAAAVERTIGVPVIPSGALALNALKLSQQVPARLEFKTAGPSRTIRIGEREISLQHAPARRFRAPARSVGLIVEALEAIGRHHVTDGIIATIRSVLRSEDRAVVRKHIGDAPGWMQPHLRDISTE